MTSFVHNIHFKILLNSLFLKKIKINNFLNISKFLLDTPKFLNTLYNFKLNIVNFLNSYNPSNSYLFIYLLLFF